MPAGSGRLSRVAPPPPALPLPLPPLVATFSSCCRCPVTILLVNTRKPRRTATSCIAAGHLTAAPAAACRHHCRHPALNGGLNRRPCLHAAPAARLAAGGAVQGRCRQGAGRWPPWRSPLGAAAAAGDVAGERAGLHMADGAACAGASGIALHRAGQLHAGCKVPAIRGRHVGDG